MCHTLNNRINEKNHNRQKNFIRSKMGKKTFKNQNFWCSNVIVSYIYFHSQKHFPECLRLVKACIPKRIFYPHLHSLPIFCLNPHKKGWKTHAKPIPFTSLVCIIKFLRENVWASQDFKDGKSRLNCFCVGREKFNLFPYKYKLFIYKLYYITHLI